MYLNDFAKNKLEIYLSYKIISSQKHGRREI